MAGTPHIWVNDGDDELHCRLKLRPAMQSEQMFETLFGLARDGKTDKKGLPNLVRLAVIATELKDHAWLAKPNTRTKICFFCLEAYREITRLQSETVNKARIGFPGKPIQ